MAEEGLQGGVGQMGGVSGGGRQATESGRERGGGDCVEFVEFPSLNCFGQQRGAGDGSGAAAAEETHGGDAAVFQDGGELENVATDGIGEFDFGGGIGE